MSATANSGAPRPRNPLRGQTPRAKTHVPCSRRLAQAAAWLLAFALPVCNFAEGATNAAAAEIARVHRSYASARTNYQAARTNVVLAWQFGRACFDRAEFATNATERAALANQGIAACREAAASKPDAAEPHYYLAMNLGQLAQTKTLGALKLVIEMEREFNTARSLDERLDFAGPDRCLGLLYFEAPGWPTSIGSHTKARHHLRRAVGLVPNHPENRLCLLEACLHWGDRPGAQRELKALAELWPAARTNLTGEAWAAAWTDWERRLKEARAKLEKSPNAVASPRQKE